MSMLFTVLTVLTLGVGINYVEGHGRLIEPPARSTLWRYGFTSAEKNYDDNQLNCGGFSNQHNQQGGKCGLCGDPYQGPRENEANGKYAQGIIAKTYTSSSDITVTAEITANHKGYFEFRLCENNDVTKKITQECLDKHLLKEKSTGNTKLNLNSDLNQKFSYTMSLPAGVTCSQCVLQWKYTAGNNWGTDENGTECNACVPQEQFYGCSDVAIVSSNTPSTGSTTKSSTLLTTILKSSAISSTTTHPVTPTTTQPVTAPIVASSTIKGSTTTTTQKSTSTTSPGSTVTSPISRSTTTQSVTPTCVGLAPFNLGTAGDAWCVLNCNYNPPYCPASHCSCT